MVPWYSWDRGRMSGRSHRTEAADAGFWRTLRDAVRHGVEAYAYRCEVSRIGIDIAEGVPVRPAYDQEIFRDSSVNQNVRSMR